MGDEFVRLVLDYIKKHGDNHFSRRAHELSAEFEEYVSNSKRFTQGTGAGAQHDGSGAGEQEPLQGKGPAVGGSHAPFSPAKDVADKISDQAKASTKA